MTVVPKEFTFKTKVSDSLLRMKIVDDQYRCNYADQEITERSAVHNHSAIQRHLDEGWWIVVENLDEVPKVNHELNYPIYYKHRDYADCGVITKGAGKFIRVELSDGCVNEDTWDEEWLRRFIKDGIWIVTHSGSYLPEKKTSSPEPSEAPTNDLCKPLVMPLSFDTTEALAGVRILHSAIEEASKAADVLMEKLVAIQNGDY